MNDLNKLASAHECLVELLRRVPAPVLIHAACRAAGIAPSEIVEVLERTPTIEISGLTKRARKLVPDLVYTVHTASGAVLEIWIFEAQMSKDWLKRWRWGLYPVAYAAELHKQARLAVIALDPEIRHWIRTSMIPVIQPTPVLIEPDQFELITDTTYARQHPRTTVLGAVYHANEPEPAAQRVAGIRAALAAMDHLDPQECLRYTVLMLSTAPKAIVEQAIQEAREAGELDENRYVLFSKLERTGYSYNHGREEGREEGRLEVLRRAVVDVLELRGFAIPLSLRARVKRCEDAQALERWYELAKALPPGAPLPEHLE